ncbi:MAG: glycosyltransferase [Terriglobales bacterium]
MRTAGTIASEPAPAVPPAPSARTRVFLMTNTLETGGSERQFAAVAMSLDRTRFQVNLGCLKRCGPLLGQVPELDEFDMHGSLTNPRAAWTELRLAAHLRRHRFQVAHAFDFYTNLALIPAARLAGVPAVIGSQRQLGDLLTLRRARAQRRVLGWCDRVVCNSRAAADGLRAQGLAEAKIAVIPNGLPESAFAAAVPALPPEPGLARIGMIARMNHPVKDYPMLLRAAARLLPGHPNLEFVLVGDGPLRRSLEQMALDLGIAEQVRFLGERRDIPAVLASLDISVLCSRSESLSNVVLESLAAGKPVVATRVGGNPELVREQETGLLVQAGDDQGLAEALERLLRQPELAQAWGQQGQRWARERFHLEQVQRQFEQLYLSVLEGKNRRARTPEKLQVAIVAPGPPAVGGQSVQAQLLLRHWRGDAAVEPRLITTYPRFPLALAWMQRIPYLRTLLRLPLYWASLWRELPRRGVAHVFSASYSSFWLAPAPAWLLARLRGNRVLIHYHSGEARDHLRRSPAARWVLRHADGLIVPSGYLRDVFAEFGLKATVVPNLVDLAQIHYREHRPLQPRLVCTRRLEPYYCVNLVVRAFAQVQRLYPGARLLLVGGGSEELKIRALIAELGLTGVELAGFVGRDAIGNCYDRADILINASRVDNMPVSLLEGFAAGTPVASTDAGGIPYIIQHERTGLLSPVGDCDALAANVLRLLREPELAAELAANARRECARFRWDAVRSEWLAAYEGRR